MILLKDVRGVLISASLFGCAVTSVYADEACDAEISAIQAAIDMPAPGVKGGDIEQSTILLEILTSNCAGGSSLDSEAATVQEIRTMLKVDGAS